MKTAAPVVGGVPQVNLLPPAERDRRERQALVRRWCVIGVVAAVLVALVTLGLTVREHAARSDLTAEQAQTSALARRLAAYGDISAAVHDKSAYESFRGQVMGTDVSWSAVLGALQAQVPAGAAITGFDVVVASASGSASPSPSAGPEAVSTAAAPAGTAVTATLTVTSRHPLDGKAMVSGFTKVPGVLGAELGSLSSENFPDYTATTVVYFDNSVYSRRYPGTSR